MWNCAPAGRTARPGVSPRDPRQHVVDAEQHPHGDDTQPLEAAGNLTRVDLLAAAYSPPSWVASGAVMGRSASSRQACRSRKARARGAREVQVSRLDRAEISQKRRNRCIADIRVAKAAGIVVVADQHGVDEGEADIVATLATRNEGQVTMATSCMRRGHAPHRVLVTSSGMARYWRCPTACRRRPPVGARAARRACPGTQASGPHGLGDVSLSVAASPPYSQTPSVRLGARRRHALAVRAVAGHAVGLEVGCAGRGHRRVGLWPLNC